MLGKLNCSIDGGNSTIEVVIEGERMAPYYPSIMADVANIDYNNALNNDNGGTGRDKLHVKVASNRTKSGDNNSEEFIFGKMAENYKDSQRNRANGDDKSKDKFLVKWQLTALTYSLIEYAQKCGETIGNTVQFRTDISTGLPYNEAVNEDKKQMYADMFRGNHMIEFKHPYFAGLQVELIIENVFVFVEGEASLEPILDDPEGEYADIEAEELVDSIVVMGDMGGFSTDIIGIQFEQVQDEDVDEFDENVEIYVEPKTKINLSTGIDKGIGNIMLNVIKDVEKYEQSVQRKLTRRDIELALGAKGKINGRTGYIKPEKVYIGDYFEKYAINYAQEVAATIISLYKTANVQSAIRSIYLTGGGSRISIIVSTIKDKLNDAGYNIEKIYCLEDPTFSNSLGYYKAMMNIKEMEEEE